MLSTACKLKIEDLVRGQYIRSPEGAEPSYLLTPWGEHVSRARILGTVIEKFVREDQGYAVLHLDDGTETISIRAWKEGVSELVGFNLGDLIDVIGRVREFEGEVYLVPELLLRVEDPNWELVRELEILHLRKQALVGGKRPQLSKEARLEPRELKIELPVTPEKGPAIVRVEEIEELPLPEVPEEMKKRALLAFDKLDRGEGVSLADLAAELDISYGEVEDTVRVLIVDGEIFEPKAGKFKRVR